MAESFDCEEKESKDEQQQQSMQKQTFTKWINDKLKRTGIKINDLSCQLDDGVTLMKLLEVLVQRNHRLETGKHACWINNESYIIYMYVHQNMHACLF